MRFFAFVFVFVTLTTAHAQHRNTEVGKWDFKMMTGQEFKSTQYVIKEIKKKIESQCMNLSEGRDKVSLIDQQILRSFTYGGRWNLVREKADPKCDDDLPCSAPVYRYAGGAMTLDDSEMMFLRVGKQDDQLRSYPIKVKTEWYFDMPTPMVDVTIISDYCAL